MAIFDQNIYQGVQDSLIRPGSEFWKNWLEPAITGGILRMSQKDIIKLHTFVKNFRFLLRIIYCLVIALMTWLL